MLGPRGCAGLPQISDPVVPGSRAGRASSPGQGSRSEGAPRRGAGACWGARGAGLRAFSGGLFFDYGGILDPLALGPHPPHEPPRPCGCIAVGAPWAYYPLSPRRQIRPSAGRCRCSFRCRCTVAIAVAVAALSLSLSLSYGGCIQGEDVYLKRRCVSKVARCIEGGDVYLRKRCVSKVARCI